MKDRVSVIIPTYNRCQYLPQTLESVLAQTYSNVEVLVVDDGSEEDTAGVLAPFWEDIRYFRKENGGKSSAVNLGLQHASGAYIWVFDDDDIAYPDRLAKHVACFETRPEVGFTYSAYHVFREGEPNCLTEIPAVVYPRREMLRRLLLARNFICGVSVVARRSCYDVAGYFDERLIRSQDYDMWIRLARHFEAAAIPYPTLKVREHAGDRGAASDRFAAAQMPQKQHQYHRILFKTVYDTIPLEEIFGELSGPGARVRALMERVWMMMKRWLVDEATQDLLELESCLRRHPGIGLSEPAYQCLRFLRDISKERGYGWLSEHFGRILDAHGPPSLPPFQLHPGKVWDAVDVVFGNRHA